MLEQEVYIYDVFLALHSLIPTHSKWLLRNGVWQFDLPLPKHNWYISHTNVFIDLATWLCNMIFNKVQNCSFRQSSDRGTDDHEWPMMSIKLTILNGNFGFNGTMHCVACSKDKQSMKYFFANERWTVFDQVWITESKWWRLKSLKQKWSGGEKIWF